VKYLTYVILIESLEQVLLGNHYCLHFTDEQTEVRELKEKKKCSWSSARKRESGFEPRLES
jgi:hypothetical protein